MDTEKQQKKLSALQYALSMVGVTTNILTVDIILGVINEIEEKGELFNLQDAARIMDAAHKKYGVPTPNMQQPPRPQGQVRPMEPVPTPIVNEGRIEGESIPEKLGSAHELEDK